MHYVMSDIHGHYEAYERMKEKINFSPDDKLYIIGDIIDRGPDSALMLLDVMTDNRITLLIGNHEDMMIRAKNDIRIYRGWHKNGAAATEKSVQKENLNQAELKEIEEYLLGCPLAIPDIKVNGKQYYLVHAAPLYGIEQEYIYAEASEREVYRATWDRSFAKINSQIFRTDITPFFEMYKGVKLIIGHTPTYRTTYPKSDKNNWPLISDHADKIINIDCGGAKGVRLACMRLEDEQKYYIDI